MSKSLIYIVLCVVGAVVPMVFSVPWFAENGVMLVPGTGVELIAATAKSSQSTHDASLPFRGSGYGGLYSWTRQRSLSCMVLL